MAEFNGQNGIWRTSETGVHYFIPDGVDPKQAWEEWSKNRHYLQYWEAHEPNKDGFQSYGGISKKRYNELIEEGKETRITDYLKDRFNRYDVPEDIEEKMMSSLDDIKSIQNKKDFFEQLRYNMRKNDIYRVGSYQIIRDAFDNEITEKYNKLIKPVIDKVNSIDIDNSYQTFENGLNKSTNLSEDFKNKMKQNFDNCQNEKCKIMLAIVTDVFNLGFTNNEGNKEWSYYNEINNSINLLNKHNDTETLFHEGFHAIFDKYNISESGLKEIMKKELNHAKKVDSIYEYFENKYCQENNLPLKSDLIKERENLRTKQNNLYNKVLEESAAKYNGLKTMKAYQDTHKTLKEKYPEYEEWETEFWKLNHQINNIENNSQFELSIRYGNLNDMISAITLNRRGAGHTQTYWREDKNNQSNEFFAEMAEMKATNDNEQYELIRKFAPESVKKFEEIFENIFKNKGEPLKL